MKKLLAVFMLLFAFNVQADEYVNDIADGVIRVKMNVGWATGTNDKIDSVINGYLREGAMLVAVATDGKLLVDTVVTVAYDHMFAYDTLIQRVTDVHMISKESLHVVKWMPRDVWDTADAVNEVLNPLVAFPDRLPTHYDWSSGFLFMIPVPAKAGDSVIVVGYAKPATIEATLTLTDIAVVHRPAVVYYATSLFATRLQLPTAQLWMTKFKEYVQAINATINRKEYDVERK